VKALAENDGRQRLRFSVQDSGIGMSEETQRRLFEPFRQGESRTSRRYGGTGLGLAISRQLVELMGGTIEVTSTEGRGTRVTVTLDVAQADARVLRAEEASAGERPPPPVALSPAGKLLIVDDHPINLAMLSRQLKVLGMETDTATSGGEALAKWRRHRHRLVITDLQMPEMDGYAFARAIRAEQEPSRRPTIVAFTANTQREALEQCSSAGMDDYLTKPAELATLRQKLERWLGSDAGLKSAPPVALAKRGDDTIDRARLQALVGGPEGMPEVLAQLEAAARDDIASLEAALAAADGKAARRAAHRIKGSALTVGATRVVAAATRLEGAPDALGSAEAMNAVQMLIEALSSVAAAARADRRAA
jgi:two-component system sensor histidine kinase EvgS